MRRSGYRLLPHTADMGIKSWAQEQPELFTATADGLRDILFGSCPIASEEQVHVTLEASDDAELLVSWLNEILFVLETKGLAPAQFEIETLTAGHLEARIHGEQYDPDRHPLQHQVKAVTYHQLFLEQRAGGWAAQVYVDL